MSNQNPTGAAIRTQSGARALITGATGHVGRVLLAKLMAEARPIRVLVRRTETMTQVSNEYLESVVADVTNAESLRGICDDVDTVFHLASYSPRVQPGTSNHDAQHWNVTKTGTENLVAEARRAGVRRIVFASSIKAMGERSDALADENSLAAPTSGYGKAKFATEEIVRSLVGVETTIVRLTPVYGPKTEGWVRRVIDAVHRGWLPPLPKIENRRSMVHVNDAVSALLLAASHPRATDRTYILTDGETYSTRAIYDAICRALGRSVPTWGTPIACFRCTALLAEGLGNVLGRRLPFDQETFDTLFRSAWYSSNRIRNELGWVATTNLYSALPEIIAAQRARRAT